MKKTNTAAEIVKCILASDYAKAIQIVTAEDFDPNETSKDWGLPILSAMITLMNGVEKTLNDSSVQMIFKSIATHKDFNPNKIDTAGMTPLMYVAESTKFNWLVPELLNHGNIDLKIKDYLGFDAIEIAQHKKNYVVAEMLLAHKAKTPVVHRGLPKKRKLPKNDNIPNVTMIKTLDISYPKETQDNCYSAYCVMKNFLMHNYVEALAAASDVRFNPNEIDRWGEPILCSLIYCAMDSMCKYDENEFINLCKTIAKHPLFEVNCIDSDGNSTLMVSMHFHRLKELTKVLFNQPNAKYDFVNNKGETLRDIARIAGLSEFYKNLLVNTFETAVTI